MINPTKKNKWAKDWSNRFLWGISRVESAITRGGENIKNLGMRYIRTLWKEKKSKNLEIGKVTPSKLRRKELRKGHQP